jgi:hypothetical protein
MMMMITASFWYVNKKLEISFFHSNERLILSSPFFPLSRTCDFCLFYSVPEKKAFGSCVRTMMTTSKTTKVTLESFEDELLAFLFRSDDSQREPMNVHFKRLLSRDRMCDRSVVRRSHQTAPTSISENMTANVCFRQD